MCNCTYIMLHKQYPAFALSVKFYGVLYCIFYSPKNQVNFCTHNALSPWRNGNLKVGSHFPETDLVPAKIFDAHSSSVSLLHFCKGSYQNIKVHRPALHVFCIFFAIFLAISWTNIGRTVFLYFLIFIIFDFLKIPFLTHSALISALIRHDTLLSN